MYCKIYIFPEALKAIKCVCYRKRKKIPIWKKGKSQYYSDFKPNIYNIYIGGLQELKKENENMFAILYFLYKLNII